MYICRQLSIYPVMRGDVIAVHMPRENIIPFSASLSRTFCQESWYFRSNASSYLRHMNAPRPVQFLSSRYRSGPCRMYSVRAYLKHGKVFLITSDVKVFTLILYSINDIIKQN